MFTKWIAAISAALVLVVGLSGATSVQASGFKGLNVYVYNWTDLDYDQWAVTNPWRDGTAGGTLCRSTKFSAINHDWDDGSIAGCNLGDVVVQYEGYISVPRSGLYTFYASTDDGFYLKIGGTRVIMDWENQGMVTYNSQGRKYLHARQRYTLDAWTYDNDGDAGAELYYSVGNGAIKIVPQDWYRVRE